MISNDGFSKDRDIFEQKYPDAKEGDMIHLFLKCILSINYYFSVVVIKHDEQNQLMGKKDKFTLAYGSRGLSILSW